MTADCLRNGCTAFKELDCVSHSRVGSKSKFQQGCPDIGAICTGQRGSARRPQSWSLPGSGLLPNILVSDATMQREAAAKLEIAGLGTVAGSPAVSQPGESPPRLSCTSRPTTAALRARG